MVLFAALALAIPTADPVITLKAPVMRADLLVKAIGEKAGVPLKGEGGLLSDYLYFNVTEMPLSEVKEHLAKVTFGTWTARSDGDVLVSNINAEGGMSQSIRDAVKRWYSKAQAPQAMTKQEVDAQLEKLRTLISPEGENSFPWKEIQAFNKVAPSQRMLTKILLAIGPEPALSLPEGGRIVFSNEPTSLQRPLPANAIAALNEYRKESAFFTERAAAKNLTAENFRWYLPALMTPGGPDTAITYLDLVMSREDQGITINLRGSGTDGQYFSLNESTLISPFDTESFMDQNSGKAPPLPFADLKEEIPLSKEEAALLDSMHTVLSNRPMAEKQKSVSQDVLNLVLNLDQNELLDFTVGRPLDYFAKKVKKSVILSVPDYSLFMMMQSGPATRTKVKLTYAQLMSSMIQQVMSGKPSIVTQTEKAVVISPSDIALNRYARFEREPVARYLRALAAKTSRLDANADLAVESKGDFSIQFAGILGLTVTGDVPQYSSGGQRELLRLYGSLGPQQRLQARRDGIVFGLQGLPTTMAKSARLLMFGFNPFVTPKQTAEPGGPQEAAAPASLSADDSSLRYERGAGGPREEVTRILAGGWPLNSSLTLRVSSKDQILGFSSKSDFGGILQPANAETLAWSQAWQEKQPDSNFGGVIDRFIPGNTVSLVASFDYGNIGSTQRSLVFDERSKEGKVMMLTDLPKEFQDAYQEALKSAREQVKNTDIAPPSGGRTKPPL